MPTFRDVGSHRTRRGRCRGWSCSRRYGTIIVRACRSVLWRRSTGCIGARCVRRSRRRRRRRARCRSVSGRRWGRGRVWPPRTDRPPRPRDPARHPTPLVLGRPAHRRVRPAPQPARPRRLKPAAPAPDTADADSSLITPARTSDVNDVATHAVRTRPLAAPQTTSSLRLPPPTTPHPATDPNAATPGSR